MEEKKLNLFDLVSIGVGCIIGSGIFALMGVGISYSGRGITLALFLAMALVVIQAIGLPLLTSVFELDGGEYAINSLVMPRMCAGFAVGRDLIYRAGSLAVTAIAITEYLEMLSPALAGADRLVSLAVLTICFLIVVFGDKFAAKIQNVMCILMYIALALFVVYGLMNMDPAAYEGEPMLPNGVNGLIMAIALMSYTCNGFQYVVNMGKSAKNPRRNIPLAFCLSALVGAAIYAVIGFAATHTDSYANISSMNLGAIAETIMPHSLYLFFIIGGALLALITSLVGAIISGYRPLIACSVDGWLPAVCAKKTKKGVPYALALLYIIGAAPILLGMDMGDVATICLFPGAITKLLVNVFSLSVPTRFSKTWKESGMTMSPAVFKLLLVISSVASVVLGVFYFISNDLKIAMILVTVGIFVYGFLVDRFGHVTIQAKEEYKA